MTMQNDDLADALRDRIARIIDPLAFMNLKALYEYCIASGDTENDARKVADDTHRPDCQKALAKADAVIAALNDRATEREGERNAYIVGYGAGRNDGEAGIIISEAAANCADAYLRTEAPTRQPVADSWANTPEDVRGRLLLLAEVELHLQCVRVFITTREKMHPCGVDLHDELLAKVTAAIDATGREKSHG